MRRRADLAAARRDATGRYLARRQFYPFGISEEASPGLGLVVVIPCFDEPGIETVVASVAGCRPPDCAVEIIVVVNAPEDAPATALANNASAGRTLARLAAGGLPDWLRLHTLEHNALPADRAGVGLARKLGMDEAAARLASTTSADGVIACLDADCSVAASYLPALDRAFAADPALSGVSIHYEHPVDAAPDDPVQRAMIDYELHLRYYVAGQRAAGFPYAFHTLGSALACRASAYVSQGGMNLRQGGEDFYFAQKLIASGRYRALTATTVYPGVRQSDRVPFGTGPALARALATDRELDSYAPQVFVDLDGFCRALADAQPDAPEAFIAAIPATLRDFLQRQELAQRLAEIAANVASTDSFRRRVLRWFNAFRFLKFVQATSRGPYPRVPVSRAASALAGLPARSSARELLDHYRQRDRDCAPVPMIRDIT